MSVGARILKWQLLRAYAGPPLTRATVDLPLYVPLGDWSALGTNYYTIHDQSSANWNSAGTAGASHAQNDYIASIPRYYIYRGLMGLDLTSLPATIYPVEATFVAPYTLVWVDIWDSKAVLVDANGVPADSSGYGIMKDRTVSLGDVLIYYGTFGYMEKDIPLNDAGLAWIQANAHTVGQLGLRMDREIADQAPGPMEEHQNYSPWVIGAGFPVAYLHLVYDYVA
jgi:hypothetical protein